MIDDLRPPLEMLGDYDDVAVAAIVAQFSGPLEAMLTNPDLSAHGGQMPPETAWKTWLILAGRGFGKTFTGARWVDERARSFAGAHIGVVGATLGEARSIMVEGSSGILRLAHERPKFEPSLRRLEWRNGSTATLFGAAEPDSLRGANLHFAWGDEIAKWTEAEAALANLAMTLRLGREPRTVLTTTPRPLRWLKALAVADGVTVTRGTTNDNGFNLSPGFVDTLKARFGGTKLARQELGGEIVDDVDGALWNRALLDGCRVAAAPDDGRTVVGVDPAASSGDRADACGIVVVRLGPDGRGYVIADRTVQGLGPHGWARAVVAAASAFRADCVVAEVNNGGDMVIANLRSVESTLPVTAVRASRGKVARAEPVASLYVQGRVAHVGGLPDLEDELCGLTTGGYAGPGRSPDRADALVWALTELLLGHVKGEPSVRML